jgi:hypothetical protein
MDKRPPYTDLGSQSNSVHVGYADFCIKEKACGDFFLTAVYYANLCSSTVKILN